jgi:hypothetical protein
LLDPFRSIDLRSYDEFLQHESGWAPLAGGLYILKDGGKPRPDVWATGNWDGDGGVIRVGNLEVKLELARQWGAKEIFVPESQADHVADQIQPGKLKSGLQNPRDALADYLAALDAPPSPNEPQKNRVEYYFRLPAGHRKVTDYYRSNLLREIVDECRHQVEEEFSGWQPTHLITIVSHNPELIFLGGGALKVKNCLLLYTEDKENNGSKDGRMGQLAKECARYLKTEMNIESTFGTFRDDETMPAKIRQHVENFVQGVAHFNLAFDVTPGTKLMTLVLENLARRFFPDSWIVYVRHELKQKRVVPFSEQVNRWRAGDGGGPFLHCNQ